MWVYMYVCMYVCIDQAAPSDSASPPGYRLCWTIKMRQLLVYRERSSSLPCS